MSVATESATQNPNFAAVAKAVGIKGIRLEDVADATNGIAAALAHAGPALVGAAVTRTELAQPLAITAEMARASRSAC